MVKKRREEERKKQPPPLKHAADANVLTPHYKYEPVLPLTFILFPLCPTCTVSYSPAAAICKQHTEWAGLRLAIVCRDWPRALIDTWWAGNVWLTEFWGRHSSAQLHGGTREQALAETQGGALVPAGICTPKYA